ncbi:unnamed protein product [Caenorhabditis sp. 36 PRJEB53466]|nr:unnamed protein product [Caenorhabditis sp. 36 PRJEB53466]
MSDRSFGDDITKRMTASNPENVADVSLAKNATARNGNEQMEKTDIGQAISRLPKALAIEVYTKVQNSTLSKEDLCDEIEDLVDEVYFVGETVLSAGKEYVIASSEKRGGLTTYTMEDGAKIGHRDLRRKKGLSVEEIKQIALEDAEFVDGKVWKVKEALKNAYPIREVKKFAAIFNTPKSAKKMAERPSTSVDSESENEQKNGENGEEEEDDNIDEVTEARNGHSSGNARKPRASGTPANRKAMEKQRAKEAKEKEKAEKKEKEKAEKLRKKEEEKAKKAKEKEEKQAGKAKKNGTMDKFVKKASESNGSPSKSAGNASIFSPSKWGERRVASGVKKIEEAWKKRDLEAFHEACGWCEKNLSGAQHRTIENPIWRFAIQKLVDKTKDKAHMKGMKWAKKAEYKAEMAEKRKEQYKQFEPRIKAWFSEDIALDDLLVTADRLELSEEAERIEANELLLKCMEITQFFVSMRKILVWTENVTAEQLFADLHAGLPGFKRSTYKMIANLLETALQEKEHEKVAHCNARLSEFPITEHTISELVRAFFVGKTDMSWKNDRNLAEKEAEDVDSEEKTMTHHVEPAAELTEIAENTEENDEEEDDEKEAEEREKTRILAFFQPENGHIYEWAAEKQLEILYAMKEVVHGLPIIREWFLKDANTDQLQALKVKANLITKEIEEKTRQLADLPQPDFAEEMTRNQTREAEKLVKKRQAFENRLDELRDELEENREAAARERDDLERIFRVVSIGTDRHLRKYYWFAYSSDAGLWVQDFGTTFYEKWVRECAEKGLIDVETPSDSLPEYVDLPFPSTTDVEIWYKLCTEKAIRSLETALKKNGKREKGLKKYLSNNMSDILSSLNKAHNATKSTRRQSASRSQTPSAETDEEMAEEGGESSSETHNNNNGAAAAAANEAEPSKFTGPLAALKQTMSEMLADWQISGITKIGDAPMFDTRMDDAHTLDEMKPLFVELVTSVPSSTLIEKFPQAIAIAKKCFSHLKIDRFVRRVNEATNPSCLHMLLAYFDARIDMRRTLPELPCFVCRKKSGTARKLMCKQCTTVYHNGCHRPIVDARLMVEEEGFKESWLCVKCKKEARRQQLAEQKAAAEAERMENGGSGASSDEEEPMEAEEELGRGRNAKRRANEAMRDVMEFEGTLRRDQLSQAPPPPKRVKKEVQPEVQELFDSIEKANPRLYKLLQQVPSQSRSLRNSHHETRSLTDLEDELDVFASAEQLREQLTAFFQQARVYVETHNSRKLDELDSLISELNFM